MKKIDYIEEITKNLDKTDLDITAKKILEDFIRMESTNPQKFLHVLQKSQSKAIEQIVPHQVDYIFVGNIDKTKAQNVFYKFSKTDKLAKLEYIYMEYGEIINVIATAYIPNPKNFVKQFLTFVYIFGIEINEGKPKNIKKFHISINQSNNKNYYITSKNTEIFTYFFVLIHRYISYNICVFDSKILEDKSVKKWKN